VNPVTKRLLFLSIVGSLTLGLAPFYPEPHIVGKIKWIAGGGKGMQWFDFIDLLMHGAPWILLVIVLSYSFLKRSSNEK